jgi:outer membrane protein
VWLLLLCLAAAGQNLTPVASPPKQPPTGENTAPGASTPVAPPGSPAAAGQNPAPGTLPANPVPNVPAPPPQQAPPPPGTHVLTLAEAEQLALKNNPQISVARLNAFASQQVAREARSALWPTTSGYLTAVEPHEGSRISAGALNNPIIFERAAGGTLFSQLITDFGRTTNLASSALLRARAEDQNAIATKEQVLLTVDQAFYGALQARAVLQVAQQTVSARQTVSDQIEALFKSNLKSELDASFARVNLAQAQLLLLDAQNNISTAMANLSAVLGYPTLQSFALADPSEPMAAPPGEVEPLITEAFAKRPEILSLELQYQSAQKFRTAERDLMLPNVRAMGAVGGAPVRDDRLSQWFGAVGVNVEIPIFNGFLYSARAQEAELRAQAAHNSLLDLRNRISRDVRTSWLNATSAYQRLNVNRQLLDQANLALNLAQTRYNLGLASIVELSQAELQQTQALIGNTQAGYDYRLAIAALRFQTTGL